MFDDTSSDNGHKASHCNEKEDTLKELGNAIAKKNTKIGELEANFEDRNQHIQSLEREVANLRNVIAQKDVENLRINTELNSISSSVTWQIVMKWHSLVEWLMPPMTRRRRWYDLGIIGLRTIADEGWRSFWWKIRIFSKQKKVELHNHEIPIKKNEPREEELERMRGECKNFEYKPKISIITPVWNTEERWLRKAIESIINQVYDNWEFCIANGGSTEPHVKKVLQKYAKKDKRIRVKFLPKNEGIAGNSNAALTLATGEFVGFLDHDDELTPDALYEIVKLLNVRHDADLIYSDHAKIDGSGKVYDYEFKPDWSPELLLSYCYIGHLKVIKKRILDEVGLLRSEYDGSQDYDLSLRIVEKANRIYHVPKILYLWRATHQSVAQNPFSKPYSIERGRMAVAAALERRGIPGVVVVPEFALKNNLGIYKTNFEIKNKEKVTIIIPTKDNIKFLRRCINSIESKTTYDNYEILIIDNDSEQKETLQFFEKIKSKHGIIRFNTDSFNFSKIVNFSVSQADSDVVVLLNDDTEIISPNWIEEMLGWLQSDEKIGAVGCKLIYKDGRIQHAGVVLGMCGLPADHAFKLRHYEDGGYLNYTNVVRNYSAVTAACLMTRKKIFKNIGGFNEENLPITYNDTDFCLRLSENGYRVVYTPYAILYHHEGGSRGKGPGMDNPGEINFFEDNWEALIFNDPYYNKNLSHLSHNFTFKAEDDKILLVSHNLNTEGAPIFLLDLAKSLRSRGYSVKVVSLLDGPLKLDYAKYGIRTQICEPANIAKFLKIYKPRVAIINTIVSHEYLNEIEKFGTNVNTIWIIHESERSVYFRELKGLNPSLFRKADAVVFVSNATKEVYSDLESNKNFFTIYNGINTKEIDLFKKSHDSDKLKQELGFLKDDKLITIVGTTCHRKGQKVFVNAAIKILKEEENKNIHFLIVGARENTFEEKKYLEEIKEIISKNSLRFNIHIIYSNDIPKREDIFKYYFISDIFVCTSFIESLPIVILEAMAFELPIISTDVFGVKEEIEHENSGILIKPGDYEELANKILYLLNDESIAKKIGYNAYLRVKNCFYIKKMVDGYEEIILKM